MYILILTSRNVHLVYWFCSSHATRISWRYQEVLSDSVNRRIHNTMTKQKKTKNKNWYTEHRKTNYSAARTPQKLGVNSNAPDVHRYFFFFHRFLFLITFHVFGTITGCLDVPRENNIPTYNFNIKELKEYK